MTQRIRIEAAMNDLKAGDTNCLKKPTVVRI